MDITALKNSNYYIPVSHKSQQVEENQSVQNENQLKEIDESLRENKEVTATYKSNQENSSNNGSASEENKAPVYTGEEILAGRPENKEKSVNQLSEEEEKQVEELKARDAEVKTHEQAHIAAGGAYIKGGPSYEYQTGPDGRQYAVGGHVNIDTSPVPNDPQATITKAQTVIKAALAPAEPSGADRAVASKARQMLADARQELMEEKRSGSDENSGNTVSQKSGINTINNENKTENYGISLSTPKEDSENNASIKTENKQTENQAESSINKLNSIDVKSTDKNLKNADIGSLISLTA